MIKKKPKIGIIGLGYVGLPLAVAFSKKYSVTGFDASQKRIHELVSGIDVTKEVSSRALTSSNIKFYSEISNLYDCNFLIVTVPTPIDRNKNPDLSSLKKASKSIAQIIKKNDTVIFESTVYPGVTEEICIPIIEKLSNLKLNKDFYAGYSPERINPGDKLRTVDKIVKVVSGSTPKAAKYINSIYSNIITAGTFIASSIKVAEAAKVIENTQRDLNIALINELSLIFKKLDISTHDVLEAANTKWNFLDFKPGLVGGHCIGVDPYYLTYKSKLLGYNPEIILAGRKLNDNMSKILAHRFLEKIEEKSIKKQHAKILILGLTFKEDCPDVRNSKVFDIIKLLHKNNLQVHVMDPVIGKDDLYDSKFIFVENPEPNTYDGMIMAVKHKEFIEMGHSNLLSFCKQKRVILDLKNFFPKKYIDEQI